MDAKYRYGHRPGRRRRARILIILSISLLIVGAIGSLIYLDVRHGESGVVQGKSQTVIQALDDNSDYLNIDEKTFSMELPGDWKEIRRVNNANEQSITWHATKAHEDNRYLILYIDIIPKSKSINNLLPVTVDADKLMPGDVSDNCATFTPGGTLNTLKAKSTKDTSAKWNKVDFICNLPNPVDRQVGTGSPDSDVNTITVTGPSTGVHKYFFLYTDHNIQPNNGILINAVSSFRAK